MNSKAKPLRFTQRLAGFNLMALFLGAMLSAHAQTSIWALTTGGSWNTGSDWGGSVPASGNAIVFSQNFGSTAPTFTLDNATSWTINSISYNDTGTSHQTGTISVGSAGSLTFSGGTPTVDVPNATAETLTISAPVTIGSAGLTKGTGIGTVTLSGAISASGSPTLTVNGGSLNNNSGLLTGVGGITVNSGGTFQLGYGTAGTYATIPITITGNGSAGAHGALYFQNVTAQTWPGTITLGTGGATIRGFSSGTQPTLQTINGAGPLTLSFGGGDYRIHTANVTLNSACSYSGNTTFFCDGGLNYMKVKLGIANALPTGTVLTLSFANNLNDTGLFFDLNGKNQQLAGLTNDYVANWSKYMVMNGVPGTQSTLTIANTAPYIYGGQLGTLFSSANAVANNANVALVVNGSSTFTLGGSNAYYGGTTISGGTLQVSNSAALGNYGAVSGTSVGTTTVSAGGALDLNGAIVNQPITLNGTGVSSGGALINSSSTAATIDSGIAGLTFTGGTSLTGYNSPVTINFGGGGGSGAAASGNLGLTAASFTITPSTGYNYTVAPTVTISGGGGTGAYATANLSGGNVVSITMALPANTATFAGPIGGIGYNSAPTIAFSGGTKTGTGTLPTGVGNANNFVVQNVSVTAPGTGYTAAPTESVTQTTTGTAITAGTVTISSVALGSDSSIGGTGNITINPAITGAHALTKVGANTLTLNGANTYSGNTTISSGTLKLGATGSIVSTPQISIASGATFDVSANTASGFTFSGSSPQQTLTNSSPSGTANITAGTGAAKVTLASGALLSFSANGTTPSVGKIVVSGDLNLNANAITVNVAGAALPAGDYILMSCSGTLATNGNFGTPTITGTPLTSGYVASIVVNPGAAGNITLHVVNNTLVGTTLTLSRSAGTSPSTYGSSITYTATLSANDSSTIPAGQTITFLTNGTAMGTATTSGGTASLTTTTLPYSASAYSVTASFGGTGGYSGNSSSAVSQQVNQYALTFSGGTAQNKVYDGGTAALVTGGTLSATVNGDVIGTNIVFVTAGSATTATIGAAVNVTLTGAAAPNYSLTNPGLTGNIYPNPTWANTLGGLWGTSGNWVTNLATPGNTVPNASGVTADFSQIGLSGDTTVHLDASKTVGNLIFGNTNASPANNWILDDGGSSGANTLTLAGTPTVTVNNLGTGKSATISAAVAGASGLTKLGAGTLTLAGTNTLTGTMVVSAGEMDISNWGATAQGGFSVANSSTSATLGISGGTLALGANTFVVGSGSSTVTVNQTGGTVSFNGGFGLLFGNGTSLGGTYNLSGGTLTSTASTIAGLRLGVNPAYDSVIFNLSGSGILNLSGAQAMQVGRSDGASSSNTVAFYQTGGTATVGNVTVGGGATSTNVIATFSLTGGSFTATNFTVLAGQAASSVTMTNGGSAQVTLPAFPAPTGTANLTLDFTTGYLAPYAASANYLTNLTGVYLTANGAKFNVASGNDITVGQVLQNAPSQAGRLTKSGTGNLTLAGVNTYTGPTTISNGTVIIPNIANGGVNSPLGASGNGAANLVFAGGTLSYTGPNASSDRSFTINGATTATIATATNLTLTGTAPTTTGYLKNTGNGTLTLDPGAGSYKLGALSANGGSLVLKSGTFTTTGVDPFNTAYTVGAGAQNGDLVVNGATLNITGNAQLKPGAAANGNLDILSGSVNTTNYVLGHNGNVLATQSGGTLYVTNAISHQDAGSATNTMTGGTLTVQRIWNNTATVGAYFTFIMNGGTVRAAPGTVNLFDNGGRTNGSGIYETEMAVLLGTNGATIDTSLSSATIVRPLDNIPGQAGQLTKIGTNTLILIATNTYTGNTSVSGGTLALSGGGSIATTSTITLATNATFDVSAVTGPGYANPSGCTLAFDIDKTGGVTRQGQVNLGAINLTYGGTLNVISNANSSGFAAGDSFPLVTTTGGSFNGWFSMVTLPGLSSGLAWDTNILATTGVLGIYNFTATPFTFSTPENTTATIAALKLSNHTSSANAAAAYPTGWTATVTTAPANGTASFDGSGNLIYVPTTGYSGSDSFICTFNDGHGQQTMAVNVTVGNGNGTSPNVVSQGIVGSNYVVNFAGIPGYTYTVETNSVANGSGWVKWGNITAASNGVMQVVDPLGSGSLFYRTVYPSY